MISVICGTRNRTDNMMKVLPTWIDADGVEEIIITDWNSSEPFLYEHEKVRIVRVTNVDCWSSPQAFNVAARFSSNDNDRLAKLDADYKILNPNLFNEIGLEPGAFVSSNDALGTLNGFFYLYKEDFWRVNGFDDRMHGYGHDDTDMAIRLKMSGLRLKCFSKRNNMEHLPHKEQEDKSMHQNNAYMSKVDPWRSSMPFLSIENLVKESANVISCTVHRDLNDIDLLYTKQ